MWGLPEGSTITPVEACAHMGLENAVMVTYENEPEPPFDAEARELSGLKRVVWSIVGDAGTTRTQHGESDLEEVLAIAEAHPNIVGGMMDDFFHEGTPRQSLDDLARFQEALKGGARPLDLWVVLYAKEQSLDIDAHLEQCDVLTFWEMDGRKLSDLEEVFMACVARTPGKRRYLGVYMWDYGNQRPFTPEEMRHQCELGRRWIGDGSIEGMIFLASCICDLNLEAVAWTRQWIGEVGDEEIPA
jgi:hypothetical protein